MEDFRLQPVCVEAGAVRKIGLVDHIGFGNLGTTSPSGGHMTH